MLGLTGLLAPRSVVQDEQAGFVRQNLKRCATDLDRLVQTEFVFFLKCCWLVNSRLYLVDRFINLFLD